jgi:hypothetical protein
MNRQTRRPAQERPQRRARKLDRKSALEQRARGLSNAEIAALQGVNRSTVRRFFALAEPELQALEGFKRGRADVLARLQAKSLMTQELILDGLAQDGVVNALSVHQKIGLIGVLNAAAGTMFDKERLEVGKSTSNLSSFSQIMRRAFEDAGKPSYEDADSSSDEPCLHDTESL